MVIVMIRTQHRGHKVIFDNQWVYEDSGESIKGNDRECIRCGRMPTETGADACLAKLESCEHIVAACCGHGVQKGYIMLDDGRIFEENDQLTTQLKRWRY